MKNVAGSVRQNTYPMKADGYPVRGMCVSERTEYCTARLYSIRHLYLDLKNEEE